jgi:hypothetical protein
VSEALADARAAQAVPPPEGRYLTNMVPGADSTGVAYKTTETERGKTTNVLIEIPFTVIETPTREGWQRRDELAARDGETRTSDTHDGGASEDETDESHSFSVETHAGPK